MVLAALLTVGCSVSPVSEDTLVTSHLRGARAVPRFVSDRSANADGEESDSVRYLMYLDIDGSSVEGMVVVQEDEDVARWLIDGYLLAGSPDELLVEYQWGKCSFFGELEYDGYGSNYDSELSCSGAVVDSVAFSPANAGWVKGRVTDDGVPAGAEVVYLYEAGSDWLDGRRYETNVDGDFLFLGVTPGDHIVKVLLSCYPNNSEKAARITKGELTTVNFTC